MRRTLFLVLIAGSAISMTAPLSRGTGAAPNGGTAIAVPTTEAGIRDAVLDAVSSEDFSGLSFILRSAEPSELAPIEAEIVAIAQALHAASKSDVASRLVEALLLNNLDNAEARNLFVAIEDRRREAAQRAALQRQIDAEAARKEAERLEAERLKLAEEERIRAAEEAERLERERALAEIARREVERQTIERRRLEEETRQRAAAHAERRERERVAAETARREAERQEAERRRIEEEERKREAAARSRLEAQRAEAERKERLFRRYTASADLSPFLLNAGASSLDAVSSSGAGRKYGFRFGAGGGFRDARVSLLMDLDYEYAPVALEGTESRNAFSARLSAGIPGLSLPVYVNLGYRHFAISEGSDEPRFYFPAVGSPTLGAGIERYPLADRFDFSGRCSWLPLSFIDPDVFFAFEIDLSLRYRVLRFGPRYALYGLFGSTTTAIFSDGGTEKSESAYLSIGVQMN